MSYYSSYSSAPKFDNGLSEPVRQLGGLADRLEAELDNLRGPYRTPLTNRGRKIILTLGTIDRIIRNDQAKNNGPWIDYFAKKEQGFRDYWRKPPSKKQLQALREEINPCSR